MIRESSCGYIVPSEDPEAYCTAILNAYSEQEELIEKGFNGREFVVAWYSKATIAGKYNELITQLTLPTPEQSNNCR